MRQGRAIRTALSGIGRLLLKFGPFLVVASLLYAALRWYLAPQSFQERKDFIQTAAQILGGSALLIGLFFTWRNLRATEKNLAISQENATKTIEVSLESQITARFSKAIEHLGSEDLHVRLGGLYALERIAKESDRDYWPIIEIITSYIRVRSPWTEEKDAEPPITDRYPSKLPIDIQAAITILSRRQHSYEKGESERLDLSGTDLRQVRIDRANFSKADFSRAHLDGAIIVSSNLKAASFIEGSIRKAWVANSDMSGAVLWEARGEESWFSLTNLKGATLDNAHFEGAYLRDALDLELIQVERMNRDGKTTLPDDIQDALWKEKKAQTAALSDQVN